MLVEGDHPYHPSVECDETGRREVTCLAFLAWQMVLSVLERSSVMGTPGNLVAKLTNTM